MTKRITPGTIKAARIASENGATDREIADIIGVSERTLYRLKLKNAALAEAMKVGKAVADDRVEMSLYRRATGYTYDAVKVFMPAGHVAPVIVDVVEHVPPDTTAAIFWLKNRRKDLWRDKQELEMTDSTSMAEVLRKARKRAAREENSEKD